MLTPAFELSQTEGFLIIKIKAPFAKVNIVTLSNLTTDLI